MSSAPSVPVTVKWLAERICAFIFFKHVLETGLRPGTNMSLTNQNQNQYQDLTPVTSHLSSQSPNDMAEHKKKKNRQKKGIRQLCGRAAPPCGECGLECVYSSSVASCRRSDPGLNNKISADITWRRVSFSPRDTLTSDQRRRKVCCHDNKEATLS